MRSEYFGSKFFMGNLVRQFPESPLHFLMGNYESSYFLVKYLIYHFDKNRENNDNKYKKCRNISDFKIIFLQK